jgi:hypothetical protein
MYSINISYRIWSKTRRCFITTAFQLWFRICHYSGPGKPGGTHQLLAYADDVNLLEDNIDTIKKNTESLIDASKEVGLKVNEKKTKDTLLYCHQNVRPNQTTI